MERDIIAATYNVHAWIGRGGRQALRTLRVIEELKADVIALQEVSFPNRAANRFTIQDLARHTRMRVIPGITFIKEHADFGNLILTRHPIIRLRKLDLTVKPREPRGAILATLDIRGTRFLVIGTHLGLQRWERYQQIQYLIKEIGTWETGAPLILMGDFNEWNRASNTLKTLRDFFGRMPAPPTYPARFPLLALDRILIYPARWMKEVRVFNAPLARLASDHLPVKAVIRPPPEILKPLFGG